MVKGIDFENEKRIRTVRDHSQHLIGHQRQKNCYQRERESERGRKREREKVIDIKREREKDGET